MFFEAEHVIHAGNPPVPQSGTEKEAAAPVRTGQAGKEDYSLAAAWKSGLHSCAGITPKGAHTHYQFFNNSYITIG